MRICVFCGSSSGHNEAYANAARQLGSILAARGIDLIYGGGRVGLMGALADAMLAAGGTVIGVMPRALVEREIQHTRLTELHTVATMHERKTKMAEMADGFIALPGGAGTLEEIFEQWTWAQLGLHHKPCGFLNTSGCFDPLRSMIGRMTGEGFLHPEHASMLIFDTDPAAILEAFSGYAPPTVTKWKAARTVIRVVAALVEDEARRVLLVRKKGTRAFMQPGGKLRDSEPHLAPWNVRANMNGGRGNSRSSAVICGRWHIGCWVRQARPMMPFRKHGCATTAPTLPRLRTSGDG
jgi:uncharacterized protein (TIGR00730 family)